MLRESIPIFPDRTSGQHHDIKDQRSRNRKGGVALCHFIFLFSLQMMAAFDGETDYCGISLCSRPLELEISGQMEFFSFRSSSFAATSSFPLLPFRSLCSSSPHRFPSLRPHLWRWSDSALGNEIPRDSVHHTMLGVTFALSVSLVLTVLQHFYMHTQVQAYTLQICTHTHFFPL